MHTTFLLKHNSNHKYKVEILPKDSIEKTQISFNKTPIDHKILTSDPV